MEKQTLFFVLIILRAAFIMIVTHGRFKTCYQMLIGSHIRISNLETHMKNKNETLSTLVNY